MPSQPCKAASTVSNKQADVPTTSHCNHADLADYLRYCRNHPASDNFYHSLIQPCAWQDSCQGDSIKPVKQSSN